MTQEEEVLMPLFPKTAYQKLLWERAINDTLRAERDKALQEKDDAEKAHRQLKQEHQQEMARLKKELMTTQIGTLIVKNEKLKKQITKQNETLRQSKMDRNDLMDSIIRLQKTGSIQKPTE